ncbi:hypothetical protein SNEBB_006943 [Seison nebaliae]|nr:hypothetical protein SNEBB_006943 [Seison nebaliae]
MITRSHRSRSPDYGSVRQPYNQSGMNNNMGRRYPPSSSLPFGSSMQGQSGSFGGGGGGEIRDITKIRLNPVNFDRLNLPQIEKNLYREHRTTRERPGYDLSVFREQNDLNIETNHGKLSEVPKPILTFEELRVPNCLINMIQRQQYKQPTCIQSVSWPILFSGQNMVGIAQTGSGKTLAFALPGILHCLVNNSVFRKVNYSAYSPQMLVLAPTRELAQQIHEVVQTFGSAANLASCVVYGGASRGEQLRKIRYGIDILVATPGRLLDFLDRRDITLERCTYLVLDEADRMLDMGFEPQIRQVVSQIRPDRQTAMFSATWPREIQRLARDFLDEYTHVTKGSRDLAANHNIMQIVEFLREDEKIDRLQSLLKELTSSHNSYKTLMFCETKRRVDEIARIIHRWGYDVVSIHGDKSQMDRDRSLRIFRDNPKQLMIATDVASRGLDVNDIKFVINVDFPNQTEDYVHRIGRTARGSKHGVAYTFFTDKSVRQAKELCNVLKEANQKVPRELEGMGFINPGKGGGSKGRYFGGRSNDRSSYNYRNNNYSSNGYNGGYGGSSNSRPYNGNQSYGQSNGYSSNNYPSSSQDYPMAMSGGNSNGGNGDYSQF